jgi:hypothetical protein
VLDTVFLDLDGVCCDWMSACLRVHGYAGSVEDLWRDHPGEYDPAKLLGISTSQMWKKIDDAGFEFWRDLEPYPWMQDLLDAAHSRKARVLFLTAPSLGTDCIKGKLEWMQKHCGRQFRDYVITEAKYLCARPAALLVDDNQKQVTQFMAAGGHALMPAQPWNNRGMPMPHVIETLRELLRL